MSEYKSVVQAVDVIRSFLNTHESNSTTCLWESDIDGTILKTDWGYFEEGLDEIREYCERLDADRKTESSSEKPNNCEDDDIFEYCPRCGMRMLSKWYEPKDEQTEREGE